MQAAQILDLVRPLILVIDRQGAVTAAYGAAEGVAGAMATEFVGRNVLEFVADEYRTDVADVFLRIDEVPVMTTPAPFSLAVVGPGGRETVDVIPRGFHVDEQSGWVITVIPRSSSPAPLGVIDLMLDDAPLEVVVRALLTRLSSSIEDTVAAAHALLLSSAEQLQVVSPRRDPISEALQVTVDAGSDRLWHDVPSGETAEYTVEQLPAIVRTAAELAGMESCQVSKIVIDGELECVLIVFVTDHVVGGLRGNTAINRREQVRIITHAIRRDIADRGLRAAALEDALTGLSNRGMFDRALQSLDNLEATLLFIDLDHFKDVNDDFGHDVGDQVLIEVAHRLRESCRPNDVVARIGGDEFAVLLSETDESTALEVSERLLEAIMQPLPATLGPRQISASVGFARRSAGTDPHDLMQAADRAMLRGKRTGRAQVVVAR